MAADVLVGLLQRINEPQRGLLSLFAQIVRNGLVHIPVCKFTWDDGLGLHPRGRF